MANPDALPLDEHPHDVEPICVVQAAVAGYPDPGRASQLLLLSPVDRFDRSAEPVPAPSLDLDEGDDPIPLDDQIDVSVPRSEAALDDSPPPPPEPPLRNPLSQLAE